MKRRSAGNEEPPEFVFFTDRTFGTRMPKALREHGLDVRVHDEELDDQDTPDASWLKLTGEKEWVVLTEDRDIRYRSDETEALMVYGNRVFVFRVKDGTTRRIVDVFLAALPRVERLLRREEEPFIAKIYSDGSVELWLTYREWVERQEKTS